MSFNAFNPQIDYRKRIVKVNLSWFTDAQVISWSDYLLVLFFVPRFSNEYSLKHRIRTLFKKLLSWSEDWAGHACQNSISCEPNYLLHGPLSKPRSLIKEVISVPENTLESHWKKHLPCSGTIVAKLKNDKTVTIMQNLISTPNQLNLIGLLNLFQEQSMSITRSNITDSSNDYRL